MKTHRIGIIMNGVTGRMGTHQHLMRSVAAIIKQGGVRLSEGEVIMPDPILVGRNAAKLKQIAAMSDVNPAVTTDLAGALADSRYGLYFDSTTTVLRAEGVKAAIAAGKAIYCEKPTAVTAGEALHLYTLAKQAGVKNGVVQDKLWLPGIVKLKHLIEEGFFGRILSVRGEFGYWVFEGDTIPAQRPSWNYRKEEGGGIIVDMLCHWRYLIDNLFGPVKSLSCTGATHIPERWDEAGKKYQATADDAAYATFNIAGKQGPIIAQFNSSWCVRVRRDDLLTLQVDGTKGSAVAGLRNCVTQAYASTPRPVWNPDIEQPIKFFESWAEVPAQQAYDNAFKIQWELFLKHLVRGDAFPWTLLEGAKGVQLAELGIKSWGERKWVDVGGLE